jgi:hypothetical protein
MVTKPTAKMPSEDEIRETAIQSLMRVARDKMAPPAAVAAASRTLLESLGDIGRLQETARRNDKNLNELTKDELDAEIARLKPPI